MYPGHGLGREVLGTEDTVRALTAGDLRSFHDQWYRPGNAVIGGGRAVDHDALVDEVERRFTATGRATGGRPRRRPPGLPNESVAVPAKADGSSPSGHRPARQ